MKRNLRRTFFFLFLVSMLPSCELFDDCKTCRQVTYVEGIYDSETEGILLCGDELKEKQQLRPQVNGNVVIRWECE